jgi:hypothetical protein
LDLRAYGRLGDVKFDGSFGQTTFLRNRPEVPQVMIVQEVHAGLSVEPKSSFQKSYKSNPN